MTRYLVDYQGVGGSSGYTTTVGMREAEDVVVAVEALPSLQLPPPVIVYGVSMGSAAILKAIATQNLQPDAVILELPFARFIDAVRSRLRHHHIPSFPLAELLVFGGEYSMVSMALATTLWTMLKRSNAPP